MKRPNLSTVLLFGGLFLFSVILAFPFQNLRGLIFSKVYSSTGILLVSEDMYLSFWGWPGITLKGVVASFPLGASEIEVACEKLTLKVGIASLFPPTPSISLSLSKLKKGGDLFVKFSQSKDSMSLRLDSEELNLEQLNYEALSEPIPGILNANINMTYNKNDLSKSIGTLSIQGDKVRIPHQIVGSPAQGFSFDIPTMTVDKINAVITIKNGVVEFGNVKLGSPNSDLKGSTLGEIRLGQDILHSMLNLTLKIQLSTKILQDPTAKTFTTFLEGYQSNIPGDYGMKWNASLQELSGFSYKILPDKLAN